MKELYFSTDVLEFLFLLSKFDVKYLIVGGEAVIYYGYARLTGDIDLFYEREMKNVQNLYSALNDFWNNEIPGIDNEIELLQEGIVWQFGVPPNRIDLMNKIENINFSSAWKNRTDVKLKYDNNKFTAYYIGLKELIKNKEAVNRYKDKDDLKFLKEIKSKRK